ncbi:hypothetical protein BG000_007726 [Podila horticola]|nr:hypothetical protein BG000_007726 [Podila horticola]
MNLRMQDGKVVIDPRTALLMVTGYTADEFSFQDMAADLEKTTDLEFYNGPSWRSMLSPITPAQLKYVNALQTCQSNSYQKTVKHNELPEGEGVTFYQFDRIEDRDIFKELFRKRLNQIEVDEHLQQYIVKESCRAFAMTVNLFQEFDDEIEGSTTMPVPMSTA